MTGLLGFLGAIRQRTPLQVYAKGTVWAQGPSRRKLRREQVAGCGSLGAIRQRTPLQVCARGQSGPKGPLIAKKRLHRQTRRLFSGRAWIGKVGLQGQDQVRAGPAGCAQDQARARARPRAGPGPGPGRQGPGPGRQGQGQVLKAKDSSRGF